MKIFLKSCMMIVPIHKRFIDKLGITRDNVGEISKYAADMYLGDRFDEVEAEFMSLRRRT